jgi:hypothetical protein
MKRFNAGLLGMLVAISSVSAIPEETDRYAEALQSKAVSQTVQSLAMLCLALPHEKDVHSQLDKYLWINQPHLDMSDAPRTLETAKIRGDLKSIAMFIKEHTIRELELRGITMVGVKECMDFYFACATTSGPAVIRVSVAFTAVGPWVHEFRLFEGWEKVRSIMGQVQYHPRDKVASVTYEPKTERKDAGR